MQKKVIINLSVQANLPKLSNKLATYCQITALQRLMDAALSNFGIDIAKSIKEHYAPIDKLEYFPTLEYYPGEGIRLRACLETKLNSKVEEWIYRWQRAGMHIVYKEMNMDAYCTTPVRRCETCEMQPLPEDDTDGCFEEELNGNPLCSS